MEYLSYYIPPTPNKIWEDKDQQTTASFGEKTDFFNKNGTASYLATTPNKSFYTILVDVFF